MLTELDLHHSPFVFDCFLGNSDISFPRLVKLTIGSSCFDEEENDGPVDANILIPHRFPVLQRLSFADLSRSDLEWLEVAFSHNWASISELAFLDSSSYLEFATIANHVPNLTRLTVKGYDNSLNINLAAGHWPHLQHLDIDSPVRFQYDASNNPQPQLTSLKSFIFTTTWSMGQNSIRQQILDFILHGAPNLELIELNEGCFHESVLSMARDQVNLSVRTLSIEIELDRFDAATAKTFIGMFPNLKLLKAKGKDYAAIQQLKEDHPNLRIQYC
ncbi:hypothetical protein GQ42DRAFT_153999 [Ramicandelaber brevisporus]|nr:hypothetical protein GQ42DRAFT_153999 [Ramicandelaber brevisporus]